MICLSKEHVPRLPTSELSHKKPPKLSASAFSGAFPALALYSGLDPLLDYSFGVALVQDRRDRQLAASKYCCSVFPLLRTEMD